MHEDPILDRSNRGDEVLILRAANLSLVAPAAINRFGLMPQIWSSALRRLKRLGLVGFGLAFAGVGMRHELTGPGFGFALAGIGSRREVWR
jgi:hypothetical protein